MADDEYKPPVGKSFIPQVQFGSTGAPIPAVVASKSGGSGSGVAGGSGGGGSGSGGGGGGGGDKYWLVAITDDGNERLTCIQTRNKPRIQRVPDLLRQANDWRWPLFFEPEVVSLGPYYHGKAKFAAMEENKWAAAARFAGGQTAPMSVFYHKVRSVAGAARECYANRFDNIDEEYFAKMMFFDGCFILHFIDCLMNVGTTSPTTKAHLRGFITRDMFLLENQVPFVVLQALMSLRPVKYKEFVRMITGATSMMESSSAASTTSVVDVGGWKKKLRQAKWKSCHPYNGYEASWQSTTAPKGTTTGGGGADAEEGPAHLLDLLRTELLGGREQPKKRPGRRVEAANSWQFFRSVMELKELGIEFGKSPTSCLRDVAFTGGLVYGHLRLPTMVVDDMARPKFLNLVALEMCPDGNYDYGVTSYLCFLDSLIDHADDVKELRRKKILLNGLGSDQQVADLFNQLTNGLTPELYAYEDTIAKINQHCENKKKVSFATMYHTHFDSPWTTISFFAAVFLILLTTAQTFFAIFPKFAASS